MIESENDRLAMLRDLGEQFEAGGAPFFAVFDRERVEIVVGEHLIDSRETFIACRSSDIEAHKIIRDSVIRRATDGATYVVKNIEPDGTGMSVVYLKT